MGKKKLKLQALIFNKSKFSSRTKVKDWILRNDYKIDKRLKKPIMKEDKTFRVRQRNPDWFNKKTFKVETLSNGIKGVYGFLKER